MVSTNLPFACFNETIKTLQEMARKKVFVSYGSDKVSPVLEKSIIGRYSRRDQARDTRGRDRRLDKPGFIVTYMGMHGGPSQGSLCHDDRNIRILVQLVDDTDGFSDTNAETYFEWMVSVREWLQTNPYANNRFRAGHVHLVHVTDESLPDEDDWAIDREMRMFTMVNCFARMRRTKDQGKWRST
jgi:hypothetical protein